MADTYTVFVLRNGEMVQTTGTSPTTPGTPGVVNWDDIQNKPLTFPPSDHSTEIGDVNGLTDRLTVVETAVAGAVDQSYVDANTAWAHGIQPRVVWTGSVWPTRSSTIPVGYTGAVEYWSPYDATATSPTDRLLNDLWTRKRVG